MFIMSLPHLPYHTLPFPDTVLYIFADYTVKHTCNLDPVTACLTKWSIKTKTNKSVPLFQSSSAPVNLFIRPISTKTELHYLGPLLDETLENRCINQRRGRH